MTVTVGQALQAGTNVLRRAGVPDAASDARRLMAHALGVRPDRLTLVLSERLPPHADDLFRLHVEERAHRKPVSQITGTRLFWGREFLVTPDVLDPRPETETLVAEALAGSFSRVLDLGTGSGCILATLLKERPVATGLGVDLSKEALHVARRNARRLEVSERAYLVQGDWLGPVTGTYDLIVSNPPYIASAEMDALDPEVRLHEPRLALTDEGDGLSAYRTILRDAPAHLAPEGRLIVEVGSTQAESVLAIGRAAGLARAETRPDLDGRARVCLFRRP